MFQNEECVDVTILLGKNFERWDLKLQNFILSDCNNLYWVEYSFINSINIWVVLFVILCSDKYTNLLDLNIC